MGELAETPKHNDLIYDVGMHKGEDSEFYLQKGFRVVGIEADPDLAQHCRARLQKFLDSGRLTIIEGAVVDPAALVDGRTKVRFFKNSKASVWGTVQPDWVERNLRLGSPSSATEVDAIDFVDVIAHYGVPHYMKIDIEGSDMVCVEALRNFRERPTYLSLESDKTSFANVQREIAILEGLGYDGFQAIEQSGIAQCQIPPTPSREGVYVAHTFEGGSSGLFGAELEGEWKSHREILQQYRAIFVGYMLLDRDGGLLRKWRLPGGYRLRAFARQLLKPFIRANIPGFYDTHARRSGALSNGATS
ncbi:MAG: FkbM family methyltransferase [Planctomycetaceae bacterium]